VALHQKEGDSEVTERTHIHREIRAHKADVRAIQNCECYWLSKMKDLPKVLSLMDDSRKEASDAVTLPLTVGDFQKKHKNPSIRRL
jgi:hypothetical protein